jgi:spermidine/putrescine transport system substrate-binding protein
MWHSISRLTTTIFLILAFAIFGCQRGGRERGEKPTLNVLAWVGYEEDEVRRPFEEETGVSLRFDTFTGGDRMFAKLSQAPNLYDVVVVDPEYIAKLHGANLISPLDASEFDFSDYLTPFQKFPLCWIDGKLWAVLIRYGTNALVYNTKYVTPGDVQSYSVLWSPKVKGKVGFWDWYLPSMGVLSLADGNTTEPYSLSRAQLDDLQKKALSLKPRIAGVLDSLSSVSNALANEDFWIVPGVGEHAAAVLAEQGHPIAWDIPKEGAIMWIETLAIPRQAPHPELAKRYIRYMMRPEIQAKMAWRKAYRSGVPSRAALKFLTPEQRQVLHVPTVEAAERLVSALHVRKLPTFPDGRSAEAEWQSIWSGLKAK